MANAVAGYVTERILAALDAGVVPWRKPWRVGADRNLISGRPYSGINVWLTAYSRERQGFKSGWWLTMKQANAKGWKVKAGSKATMVVFWKVDKVRDTKPDGETETRKRFMLRYYLVFNAEQVDGAVVPATETRTHQPIAEAEAMAAGYLAPTPGGPVLRHVAADGAFYAPAFDTIQLPPPEAFKSGEHYYLTLAHEMVHSTGHKSRLNRLDGAVARQGGSYAREELVAEIGAAMLAAHVGIESDGLIADSAAYIRHWRDTIAKDNGLVISAASRAEKAFHHIVKDVPENLAEAEREAEGGAA